MRIVLCAAALSAATACSGAREVPTAEPIAAACGAARASHADTSSPGVPAQRSALIGATTSSAGKWPWLGHLLLAGKHHCGAALLSAEWIVTAAHCITAANGQPLQAVFGDYDATAAERTEQAFDLAEIVVHPEFNSANGLIDDHDLALARLSVDADFDRAVQSIEVEACAAPDRVWIAGWGKRGIDEPASDKVEAVQVSVLDTTACRMHLTSLDAAEQSGDVLCVGDASGDPGACHKDSGDPAMSKSADGAWQLVGVVSSGGPECDEYTIATRLERFRDWISMYVET